MLARQADQKLYHDKNSKHCVFVPGERVMIRDFRHTPRQVETMNNSGKIGTSHLQCSGGRP